MNSRAIRQLQRSLASSSALMLTPEAAVPVSTYKYTRALLIRLNQQQIMLLSDFLLSVWFTTGRHPIRYTALNCTAVLACHTVLVRFSTVSATRDPQRESLATSLLLARASTCQMLLPSSADRRSEVQRRRRRPARDASGMRRGSMGNTQSAPQRTARWRQESVRSTMHAISPHPTHCCSSTPWPFRCRWSAICDGPAQIPMWAAPHTH